MPTCAPTHPPVRGCTRPPAYTHLPVRLRTLSCMRPRTHPSMLRLSAAAGCATGSSCDQTSGPDPGGAADTSGGQSLPTPRSRRSTSSRMPLAPFPQQRRSTARRRQTRITAGGGNGNVPRRRRNFPPQVAALRSRLGLLRLAGAGSAYLGWPGRVELGTGNLATKPCVLEVERDASMNDPV